MKLFIFTTGDNKRVLYLSKKFIFARITIVLQIKARFGAKELFKPNEVIDLKSLGFLKSVEMTNVMVYPLRPWLCGPFS